MYLGEPAFHSPNDSFRDPDAISLAFLISMGITFGFLMILLVTVALYLTFFHTDEVINDIENRVDFNTNPPKKQHTNILLDGSFIIAKKPNNIYFTKEQEISAFAKMSLFEIELYNRSQEFQKMNPPVVKSFGTYINAKDKQYIKDRGIQSYYLLPSINDNIDEFGSFLPSFYIQDKLNVIFTKYNKSSSTIMNYPLPFNKKDSVYFEIKIFRYTHDSNSIFSCGLVTCPYPYFRLPGMALYSIAYESTGKLRINNPFYANTLLPKLQEGDVVGFGFRFKTGSIYITHNGKKLMDLAHNVDVDLFISIGAINASYTKTYTKEGLLSDPDNPQFRNEYLVSQLNQQKDTPGLINPQLLDAHNPREEEIESDEIELQVNLGQLGFVFIEANVKKYAFGSALGDIGNPPSYNGEELKQDIVLQKGDDLPPKYSDKEIDFFGNIKANATNGNKTLNRINQENNFSLVNNTEGDESFKYKKIDEVKSATTGNITNKNKKRKKSRHRKK